MDEVPKRVIDAFARLELALDFHSPRPEAPHGPARPDDPLCAKVLTAGLESERFTDLRSYLLTAALPS